MRLLVCTALCLLACAAVGCSSGAESEHTWSGPPEPGENGVVFADDFASHQSAIDEHWERSAAMAAAEFLRLDERTAATTTIEATAGPEGTGPQTVVVTLDGLADDSVRAERWTLEFDEEDGTYVLTAARRDFSCQAGRGHESFSPDGCL